MLTTTLAPSYRDILAKNTTYWNSFVFSLNIDVFVRNGEKQQRQRRSVTPEQWQKFKTQFQKDGNGANEQAHNFLTLIFEMIHIVRPVIYVLSIVRNGTQSWRPWILSFILEVVPILYAFKTTPPSAIKNHQEINRRIGLLFYYILRSPFFELLTR